MNEFQTELDIASIDFNHKLKTETAAIIEASNSKVICLDMFSNGLISYLSKDYIPAEYNNGCIICNNDTTFFTILKPPKDLFQKIPCSEFAKKSAELLTHRYNTDIGVTISGISSFPINNNILNQKIFLGYSIQGTQTAKILECTGSASTTNTQLINGLFGYLIMLIKKYSLEKTKEKKYG